MGRYMLRERLAIFSAASKESDFIMEQAGATEAIFKWGDPARLRGHALSYKSGDKNNRCIWFYHTAMTAKNFCIIQLHHVFLMYLTLF